MKAGKCWHGGETDLSRKRDGHSWKVEYTFGGCGNAGRNYSLELDSQRPSMSTEAL